MPPDAGELSGCVLGPVEVGEGVLSTMDETSVPGVVTAPELDCVLLSALPSAFYTNTMSTRLTLTLACMIN